MREQVISHKVGNRTGMSGQRRSSSMTQKPARRDSAEPMSSRLRSLLGYVPTVLKLALAIVIGVLVFAGYRAAASASFFQVRRVEVQGVSRVSADEVKSIVTKEGEKTGVWNADLNGISERLQRLPWVRTAVVSRVLPDGLRVRIVERTPRAVVRTGSGRFRWIDEDAVLLGEMLPTDQVPAFFLRGLNEEESTTARTENRERVQKFMELERDWNTAGLSERVSEVNVMDVRDIRAQLAGDSSLIEVRLGSQDHEKRLRDALRVLDAERQTPRGALISYIDMSQGRRAIVGLTSGAQTTSDDPAPPEPEVPSSANANNARTAVASAQPVRANAPVARNVEPKTEKNKKPTEKKSEKANTNTNRRRQ